MAKSDDYRRAAAPGDGCCQDWREMLVPMSTRCSTRSRPPAGIAARPRLAAKPNA